MYSSAWISKTLLVSTVQATFWELFRPHFFQGFLVEPMQMVHTYSYMVSRAVHRILYKEWNMIKVVQPTTHYDQPIYRLSCINRRSTAEIPLTSEPCSMPQCMRKIDLIGAEWYFTSADSDDCVTGGAPADFILHHGCCGCCVTIGAVSWLAYSIWIFAVLYREAELNLHAATWVVERG
jgi:hypothetical protein